MYKQSTEHLMNIQSEKNRSIWCTNSKEDISNIYSECNREIRYTVKWLPGGNALKIRQVNLLCNLKWRPSKCLCKRLMEIRYTHSTEHLNEYPIRKEHEHLMYRLKWRPSQNSFRRQQANQVHTVKWTPDGFIFKLKQEILL